MPNCGHCGSFVTRQYVRVFTPRDSDSVRVCPECPDRIRDGNSYREARSTRRNTATATGGDA